MSTTTTRVANYTTTVGRPVTVTRTLTAERIPYVGTETSICYDVTCSACGAVYADTVTSLSASVNESAPAGDADTAARQHANECTKGGAAR